MQFPRPGVGRRLLAFDEALNRAAGEDWHRRPYRTFGNPSARGVYHAEWATFANAKNRNPINYHGPLEMRCAAISAVFDADHGRKLNDIVGVRLTARWKPKGDGWGAGLWYYTFEGGRYPRSLQPDEHLLLFFHYATTKGDYKPRIELRRGGLTWYGSTVHKDKGDEHPTHYTFRVDPADPAAALAAKRRVPDDEVRRVLASPEALRDYAITMHQALLKQIDRQFGDRTALRGSELMRMLHPGEDPAALSTHRELSEEEYRAMHEKARSEVQEKIRLIEQDYREMFDALTSAFPLLECLNKAAKAEENEKGRPPGKPGGDK